MHPDEFAQLRLDGLAMGFKYIASGPLVRSSYRASEAFLRGILQTNDLNAATVMADSKLSSEGSESGVPSGRRSLTVVG